MLAKLWKKVLLAVCIIACIFNIMTKLVNRNSLEVNLKSANDGNTVFDFTRKDSDSQGSGIIDGVHEIMNVTRQQNDTNVISQEVNAENNDSQEKVNSESNSEVTTQENKESEEKKDSKGIQYKDFTLVELF